MSIHTRRRVLCLTSWYPPHHFGGYEASCRDVMERLSERGHDVHVLTSDHRHDGVADTDPSTLHRHLRLYFRDGDLWTPSVPGRVAVERHNRKALAAVLEEVRPDVVSVWHVGAMSLGLLGMLVERGIPVVFAVSDEWPVYAPRLDAWIRLCTYRPAIAKAVGRLTGLPTALPAIGDAGPFCFISEVTRAKCVAGSPWTFATSGVVYSGMDYDFFASSGLEAPSQSSGEFTVLYVGRIDERKGIRTLVKAIAALESSAALDVRLVIDGRASEADSAMLQEWTRAEGVTDRVTVQCSERSRLPDVYRGASVCVFPSEWEEPFGLVPLEAMAAGTPVVASGVGGSGEFLMHNDNAVLFEPGNADSLAEAITTVLSDDDLRADIVDAGRRTARFFDADRLAETFEAWHDYAVDGGPPPPDRSISALG